MGEAAATGIAVGRNLLVLVAPCTFRHRPVRKAGLAPSFDDVAKARVESVRQWLAWMRLREDA